MTVGVATPTPTELCVAHRDYQRGIGWSVGAVVTWADGSASFLSRTTIITYTSDGRTVATSL